MIVLGGRQFEGLLWGVDLFELPESLLPFEEQFFRIGNEHKGMLTGQHTIVILVF